MITFVFPIYNQEHVLKQSILLLEEFLAKRPKNTYEIVICIDGSPDNSKEIAEGLAKEFANINVIGYAKNRGRGYALKYAGSRVKGEYMICMDCDLISEQYFPHIDKMIELVNQYDVVVASRFHPDSKTKRKFIRKIVSKCYRILVAILFWRFKVKDPDVGFKGFRRDAFNEINLVTNLNGASWDLQFMVNGSYGGYSIYEFPFDYNETYEKTTVNVLKYSIIEFIGLVYIRITRFIVDNMVI